MLEKLKSFVAEVSKEMKKVSWPTKDQLKESTVVVITVCGVITVFVYVADLAMAFLMRRVY